MQTTFFGTKPDLAQVWQWMLEIPGVKLLEEYSHPDQPSRWFNTWDELAGVIDAGDHGLAAWSEEFGAVPESERIIFDERTQRRLDARGRTVLKSPAFIRLNRNNDQQGCLAAASIACWDEAGARQRAACRNTSG
jgi:hypothetical protein